MLQVPYLHIPVVVVVVGRLLLLLEFHLEQGHHLLLRTLLRRGSLLGCRLLGVGVGLLLYFILLLHPELVEEVYVLELHCPDLVDLDELGLERIEPVFDHVLASVPHLLGNQRPLRPQLLNHLQQLDILLNAPPRLHEARVEVADPPLAADIGHLENASPREELVRNQPPVYALLLDGIVSKVVLHECFEVFV